MVFPPDLKDREKLVAELLGRLGYFRRTLSADPLQIFVGLIPDYVRLDFPVPSPYRVIATAMQSETDFQVFLDAPLSPLEVSDFFRASLSSDGWIEYSVGTPSVGFQPNYEGSTVNSSFEHPDRAIQLHVTARPNASGGAQITARVLPSSSAAAGAGRFTPRTKAMPLPRLKAPAGTWKFGGELGGGSVAGSAHATLESSISQEELLQYFADQLRTAGWEDMGGQHLGQTLVTTWASKDADGQDIVGAFAVKTVDSTPTLHYLWIFAHRLFEQTPPRRDFKIKEGM